MDFKDALKEIVSKSKKDNLKNPFFIYSMLSDLCKSNYEKKDVVKKYYLICKQMNFYQIFLHRNKKNYFPLILFAQQFFHL